VWRTSDDPRIREQAIGLCTFLQALTELRSKTVRTLAQYEQVLRFHEIPREPVCHGTAWGTSTDEDASEVWVEVKKPRLRPPLTGPEPLEPWFDPREGEDSCREFAWVTFAVDAAEDLIEVPCVSRSGAPMPLLVGIGLPKLPTPGPHGFICEDDATFGH
jgi:hypothetical protein